MDGNFRHAVEAASDFGQCGADVEVALLDLSGEVTFADGGPLGIPGDLPRR
ncbi:hypothetical protein K7C20_35755 [Streptomyces decoyicus]|nr:hypothetical protein K7C20_35755 [Streptomyces decoyicus]